jgi:hypothetical protein
MMLSATQNAAFQCVFTRAAPDAKCCRLKMPGTELEASVFLQVREQARAILANESATANEASPQSACEAQFKRIEDEKRTLYERFALGGISVDEYKAAKVNLDAALDREKRAQAALAKEAMAKAVKIGLRQLAGDVLKKRKLSKELADALIDKVRVYPGNRIEIVWKAAPLGVANAEETHKPLSGKGFSRKKH